MRILLTWIVAACIALVPVGWLAVRHLRAVPVGLFVVAFAVAAGAGGFAIAGGGYSPDSRPAESLRSLVLLLVVLAALGVASLNLITGPLGRRLGAAAVSSFVWASVAWVLWFAATRVQELTREASEDAELAPRRAAAGQAESLRVVLDARPALRREALDGALAEFRVEFARTYEQLDRILVYGDPVTAPESVVVWVVMTTRPDSPWRMFGPSARELHAWLNDALIRRGYRAAYPARISLGFAPAEEVARAGGDAVYFGDDGRAREPQDLAMRPGESGVRPFEWPRSTPATPNLR